MVMGIAGAKGPPVFRAHERLIVAPPEVVGALLDRLGSPEDLLWPAERWPALELDEAVGLGARGGHGPYRYHVVAYEPGQLVRFRFTAPKRLVGEHEFHVEPTGGEATWLRYALSLWPSGLARLSWPLLHGPLHDALVEDLLDRAEAVAMGVEATPREWSARVRLLRRLMGYAPPSRG